MHARGWAVAALALWLAAWPMAGAAQAPDPAGEAAPAEEAAPAQETAPAEEVAPKPKPKPPPQSKPARKPEAKPKPAPKADKAQGIRYDQLLGLLGWGDLGGGLDGPVAALRLSKVLFPYVHLYGGYTYLKSGSTNVDTFHAGLGVRFPVGGRADLLLRSAYAFVSQSDPKSAGAINEDGLELQGGLRLLLFRRLELAPMLTYASYRGGSTGWDLGLDWYRKAGLSWSLRLGDSRGMTLYAVGVRYDF